MTGNTTTVGIEVRADGTQEAARDLAAVDASLQKIRTGLGGTVQPAGAAAQGLADVGASAKKAAEHLGSVSKFASTAKFDKLVSDLGAMGVKLNTSSLHAQKLAKAMQQVERERAFQQLAADANLSTLQLAKFRAELGDTRGALATLSNGLGLSKAAMLAFTAAVAFGGQACLEAALQADRISKAYTTITGSSSAAQAQLSYLYDVSNRLGLQFQSTAESAKTFFAAGKGTSLEKDLNSIFEAVASAGAALALSQDDMQGAFLALGQMISKGKVQAEELRGQLGERLPGAFQLAAKAMGMTTAELDKFMADGKLTAEDLLPKLAKVMREDFGAAAEAASQGVQGAINRLSTEWMLFKSSLVDSDVAVVGINAVRGAVGGLRAAFGVLAKYKDTFKALAVGTSLAGIVALAPKAAGAIMGLVASFEVFLPLLANPWTLTLAAIGAAAAGLYYYAGQVDATTQAQRALNDDQELSVRINKELADSTKDSTDSLGARVEATQKQLEALQDARQSMLDGMSPEGESAFAGWNFAKLSTNKFVDAIDRLKAEVSSTGDFKGFEDALKNIELEARAAGKDTDEFKDALSDARAMAALGIKLDISIQGMEDLFKVQNWLRTFTKTYGVSLSEITPSGQKTDWKEQRDSATHAAIQKYEDAFTKTDHGRLETLHAQKKEYQDQISKLGSLLLTDEQRNRQGQILNALLADTDSKIKGILDKGKKKDNGFGQAQYYIENIRAEISKLNGELAQSWQQKLDIKLDDIAKKGKDAGLSLSELTAITEEYEAAADAKRVRDLADAFAELDLKIAQAIGDTRRVKELGISKQVEEERRKLESLAKTPEEKASISEKLTVYKASLETEVKVENLQVAADFYEKLAALSGNYTQSAEYQNQVLEAQAEIYRRSLGPEHQQFVDEWEKLSRLQSGRDGWAGAYRATQQYFSEATNLAQGFENVTTNAFSGMEDAIVNFAMTGKASFSDFANSVISDLMRIAVRSSITGPLAGALGSGLTSLFDLGGGTATASVTGNSISSGWANAFVNRKFATGGVFLGGDLSSYRNSIVSSPTFFTHDRHISRYAKGAGLMGEAGPEAIMPLVRMSGGNLGVRADVSSGSVVNNITITPPAGYEAQESRAPNNQGGENVQITFIRSVVSGDMNTYGSQINRAMRSQGTRMPVMRGGG